MKNRQEQTENIPTKDEDKERIEEIEFEVEDEVQREDSI